MRDNGRYDTIGRRCIIQLFFAICISSLLQQFRPTLGLESNEVGLTLNLCIQNRSAASEANHRCLKRCQTDDDCKGPGRLCRCDGLCGKSCVKINRKCQPLDPFEYGSFQVIPGSGVFGSKVVYRCDDGYMMTGKSIRFCQGDRAWSGYPPSCVTEGSCLDPPVVKHARHNGPVGQKTYDLGTQLYFTCAKGYYGRGNFRALCAGEGRWTGPGMICTPRSCSHPADIPNGLRLGDDFFFTQSVFYSCLDGYELVGVSMRTCQDDGHWSNHLPFCKPIRCPPLSIPLRGRMQGIDFSYGSVVRFFCEIGFRLIGSTVVRCQQDGKWSDKEPKCSVLECPHPGPSYNGYIDGPLKLTYGSTLSFRCFSLATFDGLSSTTITCTEHGNWSYPIPTCWSVCKIPTVENGTLNGKRFLTGKYMNHGQEISYNCSPGFYIGTDKPRCINGTWAVLPHCKPAPCNERPPDINNGMTRFHSTAHGDRAMYWCAEGHSLMGDEYVTCEYGSWTGNPPTCNKTICTFPGSLEHGKILIVGVIGKYEYRHYVKNVWHSTRIQFTCDRDYELRGPEEATCVHNKWSPQITTKCVPKQHPELAKVLIPRSRNK